LSLESPSSSSLSYRDAGVDIEAGNTLVERIRPIAARTRRPEVLAGLGGFGALFQLPLDRYREPVLVAGTDGVGTKLKLAMALGRHDTIGIDLVAMCVNDLIVQGAEPLFFLDYYATSRLDVDVATEVVEGIGRGCEQAGAALIGGETAEMPGMYSGGEYDLAGFCVGVVERSRIIDGSRVKEGDVLLGLAQQPFHRRTLGETLLEPTRIYVKPLLALMQRLEVHAFAHITGGGLLENIPRVLPADCCAELDAGSWSQPPIFDWLREQGNIEPEEMYRTFNCGIGMVVCVAPEDAARAEELLQEKGETVWRIGRIRPREGEEARVRITG